MDRKLLTNFSLVFILETYNRLVGYLLILVALKYTGSEGLGIYSFVNTLVSLLITFSGLGINLLLTREFARDGRNFNRMYLNVTILKLITGTIVYIIFYLIGSQHFDPVVWEILKVVWIVTIIETIAGTSFSIFYGTETVQYIVYISLIMKTIILATAPYVLSHSGDIKLFIYTFFTLRTLQNIIITLASFRVYGLPEPKVSIRDIGGLLKATLPFALNTNVSYIFVQTDILMLGFLTTYSDVGVYRFGFMFVEASLLISNVIVKVSYPRLSKVLYNQEDGWNFVKTLVSKTLGIATAITISLITLADYVIPFFFENIPEGGILITKLLSILIPAKYLDGILSTTLYAFNKERLVTKYITIAMFINIILNYILITKYGYIGAGISTIISNYFLLSLYIRSLLRLKPLSEYPAR